MKKRLFLIGLITLSQSSSSYAIENKKGLINTVQKIKTTLKNLHSKNIIIAALTTAVCLQILFYKKAKNSEILEIKRIYKKNFTELKIISLNAINELRETLEKISTKDFDDFTPRKVDPIIEEAKRGLRRFSIEDI